MNDKRDMTDAEDAADPYWKATESIIHEISLHHAHGLKWPCSECSAKVQEELKEWFPAEPASLGAEDLLNLIPSNWCDPLLTGPDSALGLSKAPWGCPEIEALLNGLRERIRKHLQHQPIKADTDLPTITAEHTKKGK